MEPAFLRNLVEVQSAPENRYSSDTQSSDPSKIRQPAKTTARKSNRIFQDESGIPLERFPTNEILPVRDALPAGNVNDVEKSRPSTPDVFEAVPSVWDPYMNRYRLMGVCVANLACGLNDSAAGALIPYIEKYYHIGYAVVSLIFVGQALGFIVAAVVLDSLRVKLGRARLLGLSQALLVCGYIPIACSAPFAVVVVAFFLVGFGLAINVANSNIFCGSLQNGTIMLGLLHGSYGIGGVSGPLIGTVIVTVGHAVWSRYYIMTLGVGCICLAFLVWAFWNYEKELGPAARESETRTSGQSSLWSMVTSLRLRTVFLGSLFLFAYQGGEVSISGWVISYLINARHGDPSSVGYVSAGFWAGITIGRFLLSPPAQRIGEKKVVYFLIVGAIAFQILVWFVPNIIGEAVAVSIVGLLLGPIYPCCAAVCMRGMARREALSGMGTISAFGSLGGAIAPFITGLLAQVVGTWVLHPIVIFLFVVMLACWWGIRSEDKRDD